MSKSKGRTRDDSGRSSTRSGRPGLQLAFSAIRCSRCGDRRVATQPCASCGKSPQPGEFDPKAQRRRNAARLLRDRVVPAVVPPAEPLDLAETLGGLAGLPGRLVTALGGLDAGGEAEAAAIVAAAEVVDELRSLQAGLAKDWPRPWRRYARSARRPVAELQDALACLVDAYSAADIGPAQAKAAEMQVLLDAAGDHANALADELSFATDVLHLSESDLLSQCIARELRQLGVSAGGMEALLALDQAGRSRLPVLADDGPPGIGLQVQAVLLPSAILLDPEALLSLCRSAHALLRPDRLRSLAQDPAWAAHQRAGTTSLLDACQRLAQLADVPQRPVRQDVRDALLFVQDVVEGPLRHLLATVVASMTPGAAPTDNYADARGSTGSGVVAAARETLPPAFTENISVVARHASAHLDFTIEADGVRLQASRGDKARLMSFETLTDAVLAILETALALQLAVLAACDAEDLLPDDTDLLDELDPDLLSKFMLASIGWQDVTIEREGPRLRVVGDSDLPAPLPTIGMLLSRLDDDITDVELVARGRSRTKVLTAKTAPFHRWTNRPDTEDEFISQTLFTDALAEISFDGEPLIEAATIRHMAAVLVGQQINGDFAQAARRLVGVRAWVRRYGDTELDEALLNTHRAITSMTLGLAPSVKEQAAIDQVAVWEGRAEPLAVAW